MPTNDQDETTNCKNALPLTHVYDVYFRCPELAASSAACLDRKTDRQSNRDLVRHIDDAGNFKQLPARWPSGAELHEAIRQVGINMC